MANTKSAEASKSVAVLDELFKKLSVSSAEEVQGAAHNIASFLNGPEEDTLVPTK